MGVTEKKYQLDTEENRAFLKEMRDDLLRFGDHCVSPGGSAYYLGDDGTPWKEKDRAAYVTCRMVHVYSIGQMLGHKGSDEIQDACIRALFGELRDQEHGGWYSGLTQENQPLPEKQCYAHAFVILAASSAMLSDRPRAKELLELAEKDYDKFFWDERGGLSCDTWNTEFTVCDPYRGLNANMHSVEAFLAAADVSKDEKYRVRAGRIIRQVVQWAEDNEWRLPEHYTSDWMPDMECNSDRKDDQFKPYGATPGHGLEWARLITQWALSALEAGSEEQKTYIAAAEQLYHRAVADGWYSDGEPGIVYTTGWDGKPIVHDRMHWVLAEAINTSAVLYRQTGKEEYKADYAEFMKYLDEKVLDHVNGSWFHQMNEKNEVIGTVWPGKSDIYHALQATLIPYYAPDTSIALAVKEGKTV
ncbi:MAG: AGE family epimerase/isomerase [Eubacteriales bacterium]|nr:AGE family epimerase/isomerase [Eubacteriales bacterium]